MNPMAQFVLYVIGAALVLSFAGYGLFQLPLDDDHAVAHIQEGNDR